MNSSASKSADACQKKCKLDQNCLFYKFDEKSKQCSTFSTAAKTCSAVIGSADLILKACPKNKTKSMFVYPPLPSYFLSFLLIIFFMLALLRRISFLTTIYGLYYSHNYTHFANLNFLHAGPLWAALKYCIYTLLSDLWVLSMFRLSFRFLSYTIRLINTYYCYYY